MNRREFFQTSTLFLAGSVCVGDSLRSAESTSRFRAQKIFLESWDTEHSWKDSFRTACRDGCNGVLLISGGRCVAGWMKKIVSEANRFDLNVFVPVCLSRNFFDNTRTTVPLSHEARILQGIDGRPTDNGGFLLLNGKSEVLGLVLYDSSRCLWTGFASPAVDFTQNSEYSVSGSRLMTARWLDRAVLREG